jgi:site-specific recombinase XerD
MSGRPIGSTRAKKPIFKAEFQRLIDAVHKTHSIKSTTKPKFIRAFTLMYLTGCRVGEIHAFKTNTLLKMCRENEYSLNNKTKTKRTRLISFDTHKKQIEKIREIIPPVEMYLFNKNNSDEPMSVSSMTTQLNDFIKRVLGEYYSTHSFRQGYVTRGHQLGLSLEHLRQDIGHKNIATTAHYTVVTSEEIAQAKNRRDW